jgi:hypothetical protein
MVGRLDDSYGVWRETHFVYDRYENTADGIDSARFPG